MSKLFEISKKSANHLITMYYVQKRSRALPKIFCATEIMVMISIRHQIWLERVQINLFFSSALDCGDFSDETHCGAKVKCEEYQFECDNGLCVQHQWVCDGQYHRNLALCTF